MRMLSTRGKGGCSYETAFIENDCMQRKGTVPLTISAACFSENMLDTREIGL